MEAFARAKPTARPSQFIDWVKEEPAFANSAAHQESSLSNAAQHCTFACSAERLRTRYASYYTGRVTTKRSDRQCVRISSLPFHARTWQKCQCCAGIREAMNSDVPRSFANAGSSFTQSMNWLGLAVGLHGESFNAPYVPSSLWILPNCWRTRGIRIASHANSILASAAVADAGQAAKRECTNRKQLRSSTIDAPTGWERPCGAVELGCR